MILAKDREDMTITNNKGQWSWAFTTPTAPCVFCFMPVPSTTFSSTYLTEYKEL